MHVRITDLPSWCNQKITISRIKPHRKNCIFTPFKAIYWLRPMQIKWALLLITHRKKAKTARSKPLKNIPVRIPYINLCTNSCKKISIPLMVNAPKINDNRKIHYHRHHCSCCSMRHIRVIKKAHTRMHASRCKQLIAANQNDGLKVRNKWLNEKKLRGQKMCLSSACLGSFSSLVASVHHFKHWNLPESNSASFFHKVNQIITTIYKR
jgi:hypothetical protein